MRRLPPILRASRRRGLTLVEILVALAVLGVIIAMTTPSLADLMERRRVLAATQELVSIFNYAKSETNVAGAVLTLHLEPSVDSQVSCARLVTQSNFDHCGCNYAGADVCSIGRSHPVREFLLPKSTGVSFEASAADWGGAESHALDFSRNRHYMAVQGLQVTVTGQRTGAQLRVEYNNVGRVHVCAASGSLGGYPACG